jgi:ubiquinone/menaquinone biosynthesis C-methylase UbiE
MNAVFHPKGPSFVELAHQGLSSMEKGYDLLAPKFEFTPFRTPDWILQAIVPHLGTTKSVDKAIDVCCGTGAGMRYLRPLCRESVTGIDVSAGMLDEAKRQLATSEGDAKIELIRGDAFAMPFQDEFDIATCFGALGHILRKDEARFVDGVRKTLKMGGRFAFITSPIPPVFSMRWMMSRGFNAAMRVRNAIWKPEFIMYYLTFVLPEIRKTLEDSGYSVEEKAGLFPKPFDDYRLVIATRVR